VGQRQENSAKSDFASRVGTEIGLGRIFLFFPLTSLAIRFGRSSTPSGLVSL
jgi:hypothetical protein